MTILAGLFLHPETATPIAFFASSTLVILAFTHANLYNYFTDIEEDIANDQYNPVTDPTTRHWARIYLLVSVGLILGIGAILPAVSTAIALFYVAVGYLYSHPVFRFKERFLIKNITIAVAYGSLLLVVTTGLTGTLTAADLAFAVFYGMFSFHGSVVRDLFDIEGDRQAGVRTMPVVFGERKTAHVLVATVFLWMGFVAVPVFANLLSPYYLSLAVIVPLLLKRPFYVYQNDLTRINPKGLPGIIAATAIIFILNFTII